MVLLSRWCLIFMICFGLSRSQEVDSGSQPSTQVNTSGEPVEQGRQNYMPKTRLRIVPDLMDILTWSDKTGELGAVLRMDYFWNETEFAERNIEGAQALLEGTNYVSALNTIKYTQPMHWSWGAGTASKTWIGNWKQSVNADTYPFDHVTIVLDIEIPLPYDMLVEYDLRCSIYAKRWEVHACLSKENYVDLLGLNAGSGILFPIEKADVSWNSFSCRVADSYRLVALYRNRTRLHCELLGNRDLSRFVTFTVIPGVAMLLIGSASFLLPIGMAMPRTAITMIALLTFVNKGSDVISKLPSSGSNIIQELYSGGIIIMTFYMFGHAISFIYQELADEIGEFIFFFVFTGFLFFLGIKLHLKNCPLLSSTGTLVVLIVLGLLFLTSMAYVGYSRFGHLKWALKQIQNRKKEWLDTPNPGHHLPHATTIEEIVEVVEALELHHRAGHEGGDVRERRPADPQNAQNGENDV